MGRANSQKAYEIRFNCSQPFKVHRLQRQTSRKHSPLLLSDGTIWTSPCSSFLKAGPPCPRAENRTGYRVPATAAGLGHRRPSAPTSGSGPKPRCTSESPGVAQEKGDFRRCRFLGTPAPGPTEYSLHRWNPGSLIFESFSQILMSSLGSVGLLSPEKVNSGNTPAPQTFPSPQTPPSERPVSIALPTQA